MARMKTCRPLTTALLALCGLALAPAVAQAADAFVDAETGSDLNGAFGCPRQAPCASINLAASHATDGAAVHVDDSPSPYVDNGSGFTLFGGRSLVADDFVGGREAPGGRPTLTTTPDAPTVVAVNVGNAAGTIRGFRILVADNIGIRISGTTEAVADNVIVDANGEGPDVGVLATAETLVTGNRLTGLDVGIRALVAGNEGPVIDGNLLSAIRNTAIEAIGPAAVAGNRIDDPGHPGTTGIEAAPNAFGESGWSIVGNLISGHATGIRVSDPAISTTISDTIVVGSTSEGIVVLGDGTGGAELVNVTVAGAGAADILVSNATLRVDSSIISDRGVVATGTGNCEIAFSRGPEETPGATGCHEFQTNADPRFMDAGGGDLRLAPNSPMIDAGNPDEPPPEATDFEGDPRALDGDRDGVARRDIGADERDPFPPQTKLSGKPRKRVKARRGKVRVTFKFRATEPGATFECKLDRKKFRPCSSPHRVRVKSGKHTFLVRAIDRAGNVDTSPARHKFRVIRRR